MISMSTLQTVECVGCRNYFLGGTGAPEDPLMDVTYEDDPPRFICSKCYISPIKRRLS